MFARRTLVALALAAAISACNGVAVLPRMAIPANCARAYTVVSGDSCNAISFKESVSSFQLALVNSAIIDPACDNLFPGEAICLGLTGQDCDTVRVVESGDTCLAIAAWAGIPFSTLLANNKNVDNSCSNLIPGEVLCVAPNVIPYSM